VIRLVHPVTGQSFDASERGVPTWLRSGWARPEDLAPATDDSSSDSGGVPPDQTAGELDGAPPA
jgi:hypothetical protein